MTVPSPFASIKTQWIAAEPFYQQLSAQPVNNAFFTTYGNLFTDKAAVNSIQAALTSVQHSSELLGEWNIIRTTPSDEQSKSTQINPNNDNVWRDLVDLAADASKAGSELIQCFESLASLINNNIEESADNIRNALSGPNGIAVNGNTVIDSANKIIIKLEPIEKDLMPPLQNIVTSILYNLANQNVIMLTQEVQELETETTKAKKSWESAFSGKKSKHKVYEELSARLQITTKNLHGNQAYVEGFNGLDIKASKVIPALQITIDNLNTLVNQFSDMRQTIMNICTIASTSQLASLKWLTNALDLATVEPALKALVEQANNFHK